MKITGINDSPKEPIECNPENYGGELCWFCVSEKECKAEWEKAQEGKKND